MKLKTYDGCLMVEITHIQNYYKHLSNAIPLSGILATLRGFGPRSQGVGSDNEAKSLQFNQIGLP
jgi:hypothetical protein